MFWIFMLIAGAAATFTTLGMYAVWFKVLATALQIAALIILVLTVRFLWRRLFVGH
jgi:hypothetical protein